MMKPELMKFNVEGVTLIDKIYSYCNKVTCTISLTYLSQQSSGAYRCEISGDAPEFKLISKTGHMTIAGLYTHIRNI